MGDLQGRCRSWSKEQGSAARGKRQNHGRVLPSLCGPPLSPPSPGQDALRAKRSQEAAEREWRRKEKEAARRKAELEEQLKRSRLEQIAAREHRMAVQVQQDRDEFERILRW